MRSTHWFATSVVFFLAIQSTPRVSLAAGPATTQATDLAKDMDAWWTNLRKDEPWNTRALLEFSDHPAETVAFLKTHLRPFQIDQTELDQLMKDLASTDQKVWLPAFEMLQYLDPRLLEDAQTILEDTTEPLARSRLVSVLDGSDANRWEGWEISSITVNGDWTQLSMHKNNSTSATSIRNKVSQLAAHSNVWQRAERALLLLQHIGTPEAIEVLQSVAGGHASARPTQIAKLALESLGQETK